MYHKCITCPELGQTCDGANFLAMTPQQLIAWCKERKKYLNLTNAKLAELSGMSQGTIDSLLANTHQDFKFGTIQPLLRALVGGKWLGDPCPDVPATADTEYAEKIRLLEAEIKWRDDKIAHYKGQIDSLQTLVTNTNARLTKDKDFLREQICNRNKAVAILTTLTVIGWGIIIVALIVDRLNPNIGFFWLDGFASLLNSNAILGGMKIG